MSKVAKALELAKLLLIAVAIFAAGRGVTFLLVSEFPDHANLIEKLVAVALALPVVYFVLAPLFALLGVPTKRQRPPES